MKRVAYTGGMVGTALAALASVSAPTRRVYGYENIKRTLQRQGRSMRLGNFDAQFSRHTGKPHANERAISRRLRQAAQVELNRANRWLRSQRLPTIGFGDELPEFGLTKRGRVVAL